MAEDRITQIIKRFDDKVIPEPNSGCWLWLGAINGNGYGNFWDGVKTISAHRFAYMTFVGPIPDGFELDHKCRVRSCCNPIHLEAVTPRINQLRGVGFSGINSRKTHCRNGHPLSGDNLVGHYIRKGMRLCRICYNAYKRVKCKERYRIYGRR